MDCIGVVYDGRPKQKDVTDRIGVVYAEGQR